VLFGRFSVPIKVEADQQINVLPFYQ